MPDGRWTRWWSRQTGKRRQFERRWTAVCERSYAYRWAAQDRGLVLQASRRRRQVLLGPSACRAHHRSRPRDSRGRDRPTRRVGGAAARQRTCGRSGRRRPGLRLWQQDAPPPSQGRWVSVLGLLSLSLVSPCRTRLMGSRDQRLSRGKERYLAPHRCRRRAPCTCSCRHWSNGPQHEAAIRSA